MPNQAWLKIVKSTKAITHIKRIIKKDEESKSIELGKEIVEKSLRKIKKIKLLKEIINNPNKMGYNNSDLIFSNIAKGKYTFHDRYKKRYKSKGLEPVTSILKPIKRKRISKRIEKLARI